ncbi:MAG: class I tRNA ligase family protein, partial [Pyrinomonadaceae bacterium]|nr:class I tRNA ligase family protein [Pyrinomonadaceae bacterium]
RFPADVYLEGGDQYRGWFNSSLMIGLAAHDSAPYKTVLTHGWVVDGEGRKQSKSIGNTTPPDEIIKESGAEILRLWAAAVEYSEDMRCSKEILARVTDAYRKIRNTVRFALGNLDGFDYQDDALEVESLQEIDFWALNELDALTEKVIEGYANYDFQKVYNAIYNFCTVTLSARYFDIIKDRLYIYAPKSNERRSAQTALYKIADNLARLVAPILAFTADEIWENLSSKTSESVHLSEFPKVSGVRDEDLSNRWEKIFAIRDDVLKQLELARGEKIIGSSLEAKIVLTANGENYELLKRYQNDLRFIFIASQVELTENADFSIKVTKADGEKCERCWNYSTEVGEFEKYPTVCERCFAALTEIETAAV